MNSIIKFTDDEIDIICTMYKNKNDIDDIIKALHTTEHDIRTVLKNKQLDRNYNYWTNELYDRAYYLYENNKTLKEISYDLLVSEHGVSASFKKRNLPMRTTSECNKKYSRNSNYFDNINTEQKAYILGLIYADGNNTTRHNTLTIGLQECDYDLLEQVRQEIEYDHPLIFDERSKQNPNYQNQYRLVINDEHMSHRLYELGVVDNKSLIIQFPRFLRPDLLRHFVRGYFDGDGCIAIDTKHHKTRTCTTGTYDFVNCLSQILLSMFIKNNIQHPKQSLDHNTYNLVTSANQSSYNFLSWIYKDSKIKMERKYKKYIDFCSWYNNPKGGIKSL